MRFASWLVLAVFAGIPAAHAGIESNSMIQFPKTFESSPHSYFAAVGAVNFSHYRANVLAENNNFKAQAAPAAGILFGTRFTEFFGIDMSFLYLQRSITHSGDLGAGTPGSLNFRTKHIQAAPMARFWLTDFFNIGVGGYAAMGIGTIDATFESPAIPGGRLEESGKYEGGTRRWDAGAVGSLAFHVPLGEQSRFIVDGRYSHGFVDLSADGSVGPFRDIQGLLGLGVDF